MCRTQELNDYLPDPINTETLMFVTSHQAVMPISRNSFQPIETYGDSVIEPAVSIWLWKKGKEERAKKLEGFVTENRMSLITNYYLSLLAEFNGFSKWMHMTTPDASDFSILDFLALLLRLKVARLFSIFFISLTLYFVFEFFFSTYVYVHDSVTSKTIFLHNKVYS